MNQRRSVLPAGRQITVPELTREERGRELGRLAQAEVSEPDVVPRFAVRITVAELASDRLDRTGRDDAWHDYLAAARICEDIASGNALGWGFDLGTEETARGEALDVLLDGSKAA